MKKLAFLLGIVLSVLIISSCNDKTNKDVVCDQCEGIFSEKLYMWVDNELMPCPNDSTQMCMKVQFGAIPSDNAWEPFNQDICGFDYEPGYLYELYVQRKKIGTDGQGKTVYKYCLLHLIKKELKPLK